ncbi:unnamed protein product [Amoebophrya sp. A120]|nr:unnamed protein product [Amoebophrya sp. A120]|eukprot:GSA120T00023108001.1
MCIFCDRFRSGNTVLDEVLDVEKCEEMKKKRKKVTVVTGFLGSGKTSFLNYVLTSNTHNKKIGVVVNEFGETTIDDKFLKSAGNNKRVETCSESGMQVVSLENGCVCCTVRGDLVTAMLKFAYTMDVDYILLECSGLSEIVPVCQCFFEADVQQHFQLDGVICVVDGKRYYEEFILGHNFDDDTVDGNEVREKANDSDDEFACEPIEDFSTTTPPRTTKGLEPPARTTSSWDDQHDGNLNIEDVQMLSMSDNDINYDQYIKNTTSTTSNEDQTTVMQDNSDMNQLDFFYSDEQLEQSTTKRAKKERKELIIEQLSLADVVLLNKIDLFKSRHDRDTVLQHLKSRNHLVDVLPCRQARVSIPQVLDRNLFTPTREFLTQEPLHIFGKKPPIIPPVLTSFPGSTASATGGGGGGANSVSLVITGEPLDTVKVRAFLADLYMRYASARILRCKGVLVTQDSPLQKKLTWIMVQGVADHVEWELLDPQPEVELILRDENNSSEAAPTARRTTSTTWAEKTATSLATTTRSTVLETANGTGTTTSRKDYSDKTTMSNTTSVSNNSNIISRFVIIYQNPQSIDTSKIRAAFYQMQKYPHPRVVMQICNDKNICDAHPDDGHFQSCFGTCNAVNGISRWICNAAVHTNLHYSTN